MNLTNIDFNKYYNFLIEITISFIPKIILALIVLFIGFKIINILGNLIEKILKKQKIEKTINNFLNNLIKNILKALVIIAAIGILGVETSSFVAMIAAVGLSIGMALSGTLGHFASGIMILIFKPYKIGDLAQIAGNFGTVKDVQIFNTILSTADGKTIIISNSKAIDDIIINYSMQKKKRVDLIIGVGYSSDLKKVKKILEKIMKHNKYILQDEKNMIGVKNLGDSSVDFAFNFWIKTEDYWDVYLTIHQEIKEVLDKEGIEIPFPQRDIHMYNEK